MYFLVIKQLLIMLFIAVSGFIITKAFHFGKTEQQYVSKTLIYFINPCLIFSKFNTEFDFLRFKNLGFAFLISCVVHLVMLLVAFIFVRSKKEEDKALDCIDKISVVFTNCGFIGIPLIQGVFPESDGVFYLLGFIVAFHVFLWTFGYYIVCGKINLKKFITNPNIIAVFAGLILFIMPFTLKGILNDSIKMIGSMNSPTAMILLGMLFANFTGFKKSYLLRIIKLNVLRFVVVGFLSLGVLYSAFLIFNSILDIRLICYVVYIASLCPVGMTVSGFAVMFGKDESYSGLVVLFTSCVCVLILPLFVALAELIF